MSEAHKPLTERVTLAVAEIITAAGRGAKVRRLTEAGGVASGVARHLVVSPDLPVFPGSCTDLRDCYLRVTGPVSDWFWPVMDLIEEREQGAFGID